MGRTKLEMQGHILGGVGKAALLAAWFDMVVKEADRLELGGVDIFDTQGIVDAQEQQAPAGPGLECRYGFQQAKRDRGTNGLAGPGTDPKEVGPGVFVGVVEPE